MNAFVDEQTRIVTPREGQEDAPLLRPQLLDQFVGQEGLREKLKVFLAAAKARKEPLDHILFQQGLPVFQEFFVLLLSFAPQSLINWVSNALLLVQ